ncbi:MAG: CopG family transcriptional regulator [Methylococcales bacterium]|nr:MAG: CopG family transcriptional regulator [Methylococcales bacterium]
MKQLILEIDDTTEARIITAAKTAGLTAQQWLKNIIDEKTVTTWPDSVKALAGTWQDVPFSEELRNNEGHDVTRESF